MLLELFPIVVAVEIWGNRIRNKWVCFLFDNLEIVQAVNRQMTNSPSVVHLLRHLMLRYSLLSAHYTAVHIFGVDNCLANSLYHFQWDKFSGTERGSLVQDISGSWCRDGYNFVQAFSEYREVSSNTVRCGGNGRSCWLQ